MVSWPTESQLRGFIKALYENPSYTVSRYLPRIDDHWYESVMGCIQYVEHTSSYEDESSFIDICSRLLYKVAKRHELGDGNKRSSVMALYLFCILNDYFIVEPRIIKQQAKRIASTKGRDNEALMKRRVAAVLAGTILKMREEPEQ